MRPHQRRPPGRRAATVWVVASLLGLVSCQPAAPSSWPPERPIVSLTMREYAFDYQQPVPRGQMVFRVVNAGTLNHRLLLAPVPDDYPPVLEQLRGEERRPIEPVAGIPNRPPGDTTTFAANLAAGRYFMICFVQDPDGRTHAIKGMATEFRVGGEQPGAGVRRS